MNDWWVYQINWLVLTDARLKKYQSLQQVAKEIFEFTKMPSQAHNVKFDANLLSRSSLFLGRIWANDLRIGWLNCLKFFYPIERCNLGALAAESGNWVAPCSPALAMLWQTSPAAAEIERENWVSTKRIDGKTSFDGRLFGFMNRS